MKEAYYFPHYCNARNDRKIKRMMKQLGNEAYAIYFMLLEVLREQPDMKYPLSDIDLLEDEIRTSKEKIKLVIEHYDLFMVDIDNFFSPKLIEYMQPYLEKRERAITAANIRWKNLDANAYAFAYAKRREENKENKEIKEIAPESASSLSFEKLLLFFNQNRGSIPEIKSITERRAELLGNLVKDHSKESIKKVIEKAKRSDFLQGLNAKGWKCTFDWMIEPENFIKILEGNYDGSLTDKFKSI